MDNWPGITRSEALRLMVERGHYLSTLNAESVSCLALHYDPILSEALQDLDCGDYRLAARSLPAIVAGFVTEQSRSWRDDRGGELLPSELVTKLEALNAIDRICVLDCVVAERSRKAAEAPKSKSKRA